MIMKSYIKSSSIFVEVKNWFNPESEKQTHIDLALLLSYMQGMLADYPDIEHRYKTEEEE